jgi:hypothetical protein
MAVWQFDLFFVPRGGAMPRLNGDGYELPAISASRYSAAYGWLSERIGSPWTMLEGWQVFGLENGSRFDISLNEDGFELSARIDARTDSASICAAICEVAGLLECFLFSPEGGRSIEPSAAVLAFALKQSRASAFARNPQQFLKEVASGG